MFNDKLIKLKIICIVCVSPARSMVKCVKGHAGYYSCDRCTQMGEHKFGRMVFPELHATLRNDRSFRLQINEDHHISESYLLPLHIDIVNDFSIDYIHCVCLGVVKRLLKTWLGRDRIFNHRKYRITNVRELNN